MKSITNPPLYECKCGNRITKASGDAQILKQKFNVSRVETDKKNMSELRTAHKDVMEQRGSPLVMDSPLIEVKLEDTYEVDEHLTHNVPLPLSNGIDLFPSESDLFD